MKRLMTACAAVAFSFTLLFNINTLIPSIQVSATEITLSTAQTLALFGDKLAFSYNTGDSANPTFVHSYMDFYAAGTVYAQTDTGGAAFGITNQDVVVYRSRDPYSNSASVPTVYIEPVVDISNVNYFRFACGFSAPDSGIYSRGPIWNDDEYNNSYIQLYANTSNNPDYLKTYKIPFLSYYGDKCVCQVLIQTNIPDMGLRYFVASCFQATVTDYDRQFNVEMDRGATLIQQYKYATTPNYGDFADFNSYLYFYVKCPILSDTYHYNPPPDPESSEEESSGGGSDYPDYSGDLQSILDRLDAIILQNQTLLALNSDIENEISLANDRLGVGNSKLDQVNSNLNKIDSHLQALQIPDLVSQSARDSSHIAENTSKMASEISDAMRDHKYIDSIARSAEMSLPNLDNQHALDSSFNDLWYYSDEDGLKWSNPLLFAMPIVTLTIGVLSYIIFGKKG